jgi:hypothetical protein
MYCSGGNSETILKKRNSNCACQILTGPGGADFIGLLGPLFLRSLLMLNTFKTNLVIDDDGSTRSNGWAHGKTTNFKFSNILRSWVTRTLKPISYPVSAFNHWNSVQTRLPFGVPESEELAHCCRPPPQTNFIGRVLKERGLHSPIGRLNPDILTFDIAPSSTYFEPGFFVFFMLIKRMCNKRI